jgi:hypothetical protein
VCPKGTGTLGQSSRSRVGARVAPRCPRVICQPETGHSPAPMTLSERGRSAECHPSFNAQTRCTYAPSERSERQARSPHRDVPGVPAEYVTASVMRSGRRRTRPTSRPRLIRRPRASSGRLDPAVGQSVPLTVGTAPSGWESDSRDSPRASVSAENPSALPSICFGSRPFPDSCHSTSRFRQLSQRCCLLKLCSTGHRPGS